MIEELSSKINNKKKSNILQISFSISITVLVISVLYGFAIITYSDMSFATSSDAVNTNNTSNATTQAKSQTVHPGIKAINSGSPPDASQIKITMPGYKIEPVFWNLNLPSSVTFDETGNTMFIAEAGYIYGGFKPTPQILKVDMTTGNISVVLNRMLNGPINDIEYHEGKLYVSHRGLISTVDPSTGLIKDIIMDLPSTGDHHNNQIAFGPDGRLYFGQGTATNSGVVGLDNLKFGWLQVASHFHDTPGNNITLTGQNFKTPNPITPEPNDTAITGAFVEFGNDTREGQTVPGSLKCNGCIISANPDGTDLEVVAWGLRNPYGVDFSSDDNKTLLVTMNGADVRGSRPIANDTDKIYTIDITNSSSIGQFYGWPDFFGNAEPVTLDKFQPAKYNQSLQFLMQDHPPVVEPFATVPVASALTKTDFLPSQSGFGFNNKTDIAFIAEFGDMIPATHPSLPSKLESLPGHRISTIDIQTGNITNFVYHPSNTFRPVDVDFYSSSSSSNSSSGSTNNNEENQTALYITSIGKVEVRTELPNGTPLPSPTPWTYPYTGTIWKVTQEQQGQEGGQQVQQQTQEEEERGLQPQQILQQQLQQQNQLSEGLLPDL